MAPITDDRRVLRRFDEALDLFRDINLNMSVAQVQCFILVALNEGKSQSELADLSRIKRSTISRYLLDLSDKMRSGEEGFGVVTRDADPEELRRNQYRLSPTGRELYANVVAKLKGAGAA